MNTIKQITFPDGSSIRGRNAKAIIGRWKDKQWHATSDLSWREELAKRAWVWSSTLVDPTLPPTKFLLALAEAGLIQIGGK